MEPFPVCSTTVHKGPKELTSVYQSPWQRNVTSCIPGSTCLSCISLFFTSELLGSTAKSEKMVPDKGWGLELFIFSVEKNLQMKGWEKKPCVLVQSLQQMLSPEGKPWLGQSEETAVEDWGQCRTGIAKGLNVQAILWSPPCPSWSTSIAYQKSSLIATIS